MATQAKTLEVVRWLALLAFSQSAWAAPAAVPMEAELDEAVKTNQFSSGKVRFPTSERTIGRRISTGHPSRNSSDDGRYGQHGLYRESAVFTDNGDSVTAEAEGAVAERLLMTSATTAQTSTGNGLLRRLSDDSLAAADDADLSVLAEPFHYRLATASISSRRSSIIDSIRILDNSELASELSVKDVQLPSFDFVGGLVNGYVVYECQIVMTDGTVVIRHRRYTAFCALRDELLLAFPGLSMSIDTLPSKSLAKYDERFLEKRRKALRFWLLSVCLHPKIGDSQQLKQWLIQD